jgi:heme exporter protein A
MNDMPSFRALEIRDLSVRRGGSIIIDNAALTLKSGSCIILRGPNGAGKSSLLRTIAGLLKPDHGTIKILGAAEEENLNGHIAFLGHSNGVKDALSVAENSYFWADIFEKPKKSADLAMVELGLSEFRNRSASILSTGQKRRLAMVRLCIAKKAIWLLDEPTAGIDAGNITVIEQIIDSHRRNGGAAIIATHDPLPLSEVETYILARNHEK